jgi:GNAT superfamily N-acetyltransferase
MSAIVIRRVAAAELIDLRHVVLRPGYPRDMVVFPGDDAPSSHHFAAFDDARAVCCVSFHLDQYNGKPAFQLRGMATAADYRNRGIARDLLQFAHRAILESSPIRLYWCNARTSAAGFYQKQGWRIDSEEFIINPSGPHYRMIKSIA